ncbi:tetratricopeptide repeat protein [Shinella sp. S4-D37]|uniref:capsular polysaccharide export protein, LipB/KpsS family n=1 Tax=Shinella sp. S4-D37 TaxID=3161999 RepID=UPI0034668799
MSETPIITAVIPVRLSTDRLYDEPERIARIITTLPSGYVPLIVDYGTAAERAGELRDLAAATGTRLVRVETGEEPFSVGHARDIGTQQAETPLILYHDIDFLMSPRSYERVLEETRLRGMPDNAYTFFALPGAYLTEDFTQRYLELFAEGEAAFADTLLHDGVMRRDRTIFENHTYAISAIVASRYHLLAVGGHDKSFVGHGAEDFELLHRLASYTPRGPKTGNYHLNLRKNSILRYEGFRAYFALYGIDVFQRGLQVAHLWHPRRLDTSYVAPMTENQERVSQAMADYDAGLSWLPPLEDPHAAEYTLVLVKDYKAPPLKALRHAFPAFGRYRIRLEGEFGDGAQLLQHVEEQGFTRTFFLNPYGNTHRRALYEAVKAAGRRFVTWDRGGLHESWFFDAGGFLAESKSYEPEIWDKPLDSSARQRMLDWFEAHRDSPTLEENGARVGAEALGEQLGVNGRKVVFVALQRPEDTATRFFAGPCGDTEGFNAWIAHLASGLDPQTHLVLVKQHPLEGGEPSIPGVRFVAEDTHVMDLIDLAASVVVINSGVGLIALSSGKPVICCGQAYYAHDGLARAVSSKEELIAAVDETALPDEEKRLRFFRYLVEDFYAFGAPSYVSAVGRNDEKIRRVNRIIFSSIRGLTDRPVELGTLPGLVPLRAALYFSYGGQEAVQEETLSINRLIGMGNTAYANGDRAGALRWFEAANRRQPNNRNLARAMAALGKDAYAAGQKDEALRLFAIAHDWTPDDRSLFRSLVDLGKAERAAGRHGEAVRLFEMAYSWAPDDRHLYRMLLETGVERHGGPLADMMLMPVSRLNERARAAFGRGDFKEATWLFEILHAREPKEVEHLRCLAECHVRTGARGRALQCLREALKLTPGNKRIMRRIRKVSLPRWLRPLFPGKPFLA